MSKPFNLIGWCVVVALAIGGLWGIWMMTQTLWPGLHQDGSFYSTVVINQATGCNKVNLYLPGMTKAGQQGLSTEFDWHGQLYYPVAAALLKTPDYKSLLRLLHWSNLFAYVAAFFAFGMASRRTLGCPILVAGLFGVAGSFSVLALLNYFQGRPEHGIPFVLLAFLLVREMRKSPLPAWAGGIQVGLVGGISPLAGFICGAYTLFAASLRARSNKALLHDLAFLGGFAALSWACSTAAIYRGSLITLVINTLQKARGAYAYLESGNAPFPFFDGRWVFNCWFRNQFIPGIGLLYIVCALLAVFLLLRVLCSSERPLFVKIVAVGCFLIPLNQVWMSGFARPTINYSFTAFFPALAIWVFDQYAGFREANIRTIRLSLWTATGKRRSETDFRVGKWIVSAAIPVLLLISVAWPGVGFAKNAAKQISILQNGISYSTAHKRFNELKQNLTENEHILIETWTNPQSAVVFDGPPWSTLTYEKIMDGPLDEFEKRLGIRAKYYFYLQRSWQPAPEIEGFRLIDSNFNSTPVRVFGKWLRGSTPGYGYAVYERTDAAPEAHQTP